jgi:carbon monoxide dehydrogenase subunit G
MRLEYRFRVPADVRKTWDLLLDPRAVEALLPGLTLGEIVSDEATGSFRVDAGDHLATYRGEAALLERDADAGRVVVEVAGRNTEDGRVASATLMIELHPDGDATTIVLLGDLDVAGGVSETDAATVGTAVQEWARRLAGGVTDRLGGSSSTGLPRTDDPVHAGHPHARRHRPDGGGPRPALDPVAALDPVEPGDTITRARTAVATLHPVATPIPRPVEARSVRLVRADSVPPQWAVAGVALAVLAVLLWLLRHSRR